VIINEMIAPEPKTLSEARGLITADYQNYLEVEWIKELKRKYTVKVNQNVLSGLK
jgi:peptidyl-prolyl cis-trans isomerase SurA